MSTRRAWTDADRELLRKLYARGDDPEYVAERLGRSVGSIRSQIALLGLLRDEGYRRWTDEELEQLRMLYASGVRVPDIAHCLKRSTSAITHTVSVHKMRRGKVKKPEPKPKVEPKQQEVKEITVRRITDYERQLLRDFISMFLRTYSIAEKRGIEISKADMFGPFLSAYVSGSYTGQSVSRYKDWEQREISAT